MFVTQNENPFLEVSKYIRMHANFWDQYLHGVYGTQFIKTKKLLNCPSQWRAAIGMWDSFWK